MKYLLEFKSYYSEGDIVYIEYWYNGMLTPVTLLERIGRSWKISHQNQYSTIFNAPDEIIKTSDIVDYYQIVDNI